MGTSARKYQTDAGLVCSIRLSDGIFALSGAEPTGSVTSKLFANVQGSTRKRTGLRARRVVYSTNIGTAAAPSFKRISVPYLTPATFAAAPATVTYGGKTYTQTSSRGEDF